MSQTACILFLLLMTHHYDGVDKGSGAALEDAELATLSGRLGNADHEGQQRRANGSSGPVHPATRCFERSLQG